VNKRRTGTAPNLAFRPVEAVRPLPGVLAGRLEALAAAVEKVDPDAPH